MERKYYPGAGDTIYDVCINTSGSLNVIDQILEQNIDKSTPMSNIVINEDGVALKGTNRLTLPMLQSQFYARTSVFYFKTPSNPIPGTIQVYLENTDGYFRSSIHMASPTVLRFQITGTSGAIWYSDFTVSPNTYYHLAYSFEGFEAFGDNIGGASTSVCPPENFVSIYFEGQQTKATLSKDFLTDPFGIRALDVSIGALDDIALQTDIVITYAYFICGSLSPAEIKGLYDTRQSMGRLSDYYRTGIYGPHFAYDFQMSPTVSPTNFSALPGTPELQLGQGTYSIFQRGEVGTTTFGLRYTENHSSFNRSQPLFLIIAIRVPPGRYNGARIKVFSDTWEQFNITPSTDGPYSVKTYYYAYTSPVSIEPLNRFIDIEVNLAYHDGDPELEVHFQAICSMPVSLSGEYINSNAPNPVISWPDTNDGTENKPLEASGYIEKETVSVIPYFNGFETYTPLIQENVDIDVSDVPIINQLAYDKSRRLPFNSTYYDEAMVNSEMEQLEKILSEPFPVINLLENTIDPTTVDNNGKWLTPDGNVVFHIGFDNPTWGTSLRSQVGETGITRLVYSDTLYVNRPLAFSMSYNGINNGGLSLAVRDLSPSLPVSVYLDNVEIETYTRSGNLIILSPPISGPVRILAFVWDNVDVRLSYVPEIRLISNQERYGVIQVFRLSIKEDAIIEYSPNPNFP